MGFPQGLFYPAAEDQAAPGAGAMFVPRRRDSWTRALGPDQKNLAMLASAF